MIDWTSNEARLWLGVALAFLFACGALIWQSYANLEHQQRQLAIRIEALESRISQLERQQNLQRAPAQMRVQERVK